MSAQSQRRCWICPWRTEPFSGTRTNRSLCLCLFAVTEVKWEFSPLRCCPWRLHDNAIHTFFPADLFGRFKAPHLSVWAHPRDLARSLTGVLARPYVHGCQGWIASPLWPVVIFIDIVISVKPLHWSLPTPEILNRTKRKGVRVRQGFSKCLSVVQVLNSLGCTCLRTCAPAKRERQSSVHRQQQHTAEIMHVN